MTGLNVPTTITNLMGSHRERKLPYEQSTTWPSYRVDMSNQEVYPTLVFAALCGVTLVAPASGAGGSRGSVRSVRSQAAR